MRTPARTTRGPPRANILDEPNINKQPRLRFTIQIQWQQAPHLNSPSRCRIHRPNPDHVPADRDRARPTTRHPNLERRIRKTSAQCT